MLIAFVFNILAHDSDETLLLEDSQTTTEPPSQGFIITTTNAPAIQTSECLHNGVQYIDGELITTDHPCEHCYCMRGDIVCAVQECGKPLEMHGNNCTAHLPKDGDCCPEVYDCSGGSSESATTLASIGFDQTTVLDDQRADVLTTIQSIVESTDAGAADKFESAATTERIDESENEIHDKDYDHITAKPAKNYTLQQLAGSLDQRLDAEATTLSGQFDEVVSTVVSQLGGLSDEELLTTVLPQSAGQITEKIVSQDATEKESTESDGILSNLYTTIKSIVDLTTTFGSVSESNIPTKQQTEEDHSLLANVIPGEGDCLENGIGYTNSSEVPNRNKCDISCICLNSIVQCQQEKCLSVPPNAQNCRITQDPNACCPSYQCDSIEVTTNLPLSKDSSATQTETVTQSDEQVAELTTLGSQPQADSEIKTEAAAVEDSGTKSSESVDATTIQPPKVHVPISSKLEDSFEGTTESDKVVPIEHETVAVEPEFVTLLNVADEAIATTSERQINTLDNRLSPDSTEQQSSSTDQIQSNDITEKYAAESATSHDEESSGDGQSLELTTQKSSDITEKIIGAITDHIVHEASTKVSQETTEKIHEDEEGSGTPTPSIGVAELAQEISTNASVEKASDGSLIELTTTANEQIESHTKLSEESATEVLIRLDGDYVVSSTEKQFEEDVTASSESNTDKQVFVVHDESQAVTTQQEELVPITEKEFVTEHAYVTGTEKQQEGGESASTEKQIQAQHEFATTQQPSVSIQGEITESAIDQDAIVTTEKQAAFSDSEISSTEKQYEGVVTEAQDEQIVTEKVQSTEKIDIDLSEPSATEKQIISQEEQATTQKHFETLEDNEISSTDKEIPFKDEFTSTDKSDIDLASTEKHIPSPTEIGSTEKQPDLIEDNEIVVTERQHELASTEKLATIDDAVALTEQPIGKLEENEISSTDKSVQNEIASTDKVLEAGQSEIATTEGQRLDQTEIAATEKPAGDHEISFSTEKAELSAEESVGTTKQPESQDDSTVAITEKQLESQGESTEKQLEEHDRDGLVSTTHLPQQEVSPDVISATEKQADVIESQVTEKLHETPEDNNQLSTVAPSLADDISSSTEKQEVQDVTTVKQPSELSDELVTEKQPSDEISQPITEQQPQIIESTEAHIVQLGNEPVASTEQQSEKRKDNVDIVTEAEGSGLDELAHTTYKPWKLEDEVPLASTEKQFESSTDVHTPEAITIKRDESITESFNQELLTTPQPIVESSSLSSTERLHEIVTEAEIITEPETSTKIWLGDENAIDFKEGEIAHVTDSQQEIVTESEKQQLDVTTASGEKVSIDTEKRLEIATEAHVLDQTTVVAASGDKQEDEQIAVIATEAQSIEAITEKDESKLSEPISVTESRLGLGESGATEKIEEATTLGGQVDTFTEIKLQQATDKPSESVTEQVLLAGQTEQSIAIDLAHSTEAHLELITESNINVAQTTLRQSIDEQSTEPASVTIQSIAQDEQTTLRVQTEKQIEAGTESLVQQEVSSTSLPIASDEIQGSSTDKLLQTVTESLVEGEITTQLADQQVVTDKAVETRFESEITTEFKIDVDDDEIQKTTVKSSDEELQAVVTESQAIEPIQKIEAPFKPLDAQHSTEQEPVELSTILNEIQQEKTTAKIVQDEYVTKAPEQVNIEDRLPEITTIYAVEQKESTTLSDASRDEDEIQPTVAGIEQDSIVTERVESSENCTGVADEGVWTTERAPVPISVASTEQPSIVNLAPESLVTTEGNKVIDLTTLLSIPSVNRTVAAEEVATQKDDLESVTSRLSENDLVEQQPTEAVTLNAFITESSSQQNKIDSFSFGTTTAEFIQSTNAPISLNVETEAVATERVEAGTETQTQSHAIESNVDEQQLVTKPSILDTTTIKSLVELITTLQPVRQQPAHDQEQEQFTTPQQQAEVEAAVTEKQFDYTTIYNRFDVESVAATTIAAPIQLTDESIATTLADNKTAFVAATQANLLTPPESANNIPLIRDQLPDKYDEITTKLADSFDVTTLPSSLSSHTDRISDSTTIKNTQTQNEIITESNQIGSTERPIELEQPVQKPTYSSSPPSSPYENTYGSVPDEEYTDEEEPAVFGPGTCRYGGKLYVSAQQIPRDDPCDFCFCFRSDIICLQQSCPPPISGCHEEPIQGFCCPRYECPVSMALDLNATSTTTTTTLPPHLAHFQRSSSKGTKRGCQVQGATYNIGEHVSAASGPCIDCM